MNIPAPFSSLHVFLLSIFLEWKCFSYRVHVCSTLDKVWHYLLKWMYQLKLQGLTFLLLHNLANIWCYSSLILETIWWVSKIIHCFNMHFHYYQCGWISFHIFLDIWISSFVTCLFKSHWFLCSSLYILASSFLVALQISSPNLFSKNTYIDFRDRK